MKTPEIFLRTQGKLEDEYLEVILVFFVPKILDVENNRSVGFKCKEKKQKLYIIIIK